MNNLLGFFLLICLPLLNVFSQEEQSKYVKLPKFHKRNGFVFSDKEKVLLSMPNFFITNTSLKNIKMAEKLLLNKVKGKFKKGRRPSLKKQYKFSNRQYVTFRNENGHEIIMIMLLYSKNKKDRKYFDYWDKEVAIGLGRLYEKKTYRIFIDIDKKKDVSKNIQLSN